MNNVGDDSYKLSRANRRYSFYIRSLLDNPTFDVFSFTTTTTTTTKKPESRSNNNNNNNRRVLVGTGNRFIIYKGSGKYEVFIQKSSKFVCTIEMLMLKCSSIITNIINVVWMQQKLFEQHFFYIRRLSIIWPNQRALMIKIQNKS